MAATSAGRFSPAHPGGALPVPGDEFSGLPRSAGARDGGTAMTMPLAAENQSGVESGDVPEISVILPVFNEKDSLRVLVTEINAALTPLGRSFEIIAVDDGSTDGS